MATVYLDSNEKITVFGPARVYGSAGRETVFISEDARDVHLSPAVERADFAGRAGDYQFRGAAGRLEIWQDGSLVASIPATGSGGTEARFADGAATISVNPATGDVSLGGRILGPTPEPVDIPLDPSRPSDPAVNPTPTPDPDPDPTPDPDPDPEPDPKPDPAPTPDPWDDPWPWPWPTPADKDTLTIRDVKRGADGRTLDDRRGGKDTTFDLAGAAGDYLYDLAITDDSTTDNDILKIRSDQVPEKVVNVEHVEVVGAGGSDLDSEGNHLDASDWTGLRTITVSNCEDGIFDILDAGGAMTIVAGDNVTVLQVQKNLADGATIKAGADVKEIQLLDGSNAAVRCAGDMVEIFDYLAGTLTVSGSSAAVHVSEDNGARIIDAAGLSGPLTVTGHFEDGGAFTLGPASGDGAFTFGGGGGGRTITVEAPADFCFNAASIGPYTGAGFSFNGEGGDDTLILDVDPQGAIVFNGIDGDDTLVLNVAPQGAITVLGGDGDNDGLVVNVAVTMAAGSRITDVEKVTVDGSGSLTVDDTVFGDDAPAFALGGKLVINQTTGGDDDPLNLSKITKGDGDPTIAVTGFSGSCTIRLEEKQEIADTITIRTKSASDAIDVFTTIENFDPGKDVLAGMAAADSGNFHSLGANGDFAELVTLAGSPLTKKTVYFGYASGDGGETGNSFAIMQTDDGILAVKLAGVELAAGDTGIFVEA